MSSLVHIFKTSVGLKWFRCGGGPVQRVPDTALRCQLVKGRGSGEAQPLTALNKRLKMSVGSGAGGADAPDGHGGVDRLSAALSRGSTEPSMQNSNSAVFANPQEKGSVVQVTARTCYV